MTAPFRLFGAEFSAYSLKVRSYLRYKGLAFDWLERSAARLEEFNGFAKKPMAPVLVDADDQVTQDSTAIIAVLEAEFPEPSIAPEAPALAVLSALIEDYADEWLNKALVHYRWSYEPDSEAAAKRIAELVFPEAEAPEDIQASIRSRMGARLHHVGATPDNAALIEGSFAQLLELLEAHLASRPYLFGARPALADFALAAQLGQLASDPTPGAVLRANAPRVAEWIARMDAPKAEGEFEGFEALRPTLLALVHAEIAGAYLPWMTANAEAVREDKAHVSVDLAGGTFSQKPQRFAAKSFAAIEKLCAEHQEDEALKAFLEEAGAGALLQASSEDESGEDEESESEETAD